MTPARVKRFCDVVIAGIGLVVLSPVLLAIALLIRLTEGASVLYRQERVGRGFRRFRLYKFRTLVPDAEEDGPGIDSNEDERVTPIGRVLRQTKLDELPQLLNVLQGEMSLVGPRPELPRYVDRFLEDYRPILRVRPGITDVASILYRDEERLLAGSPDPEGAYERSILPHKIRLAREYVTRRSLAYDLWLLSTTVACLLYPRRVLDRLFDRSGRFHHALSIAAQALLVLLAHQAAVRVRFEGHAPAADGLLLQATLPLLLLLRVACFYPFRLHRNLWRYVGTQDLRHIVLSIAASSLAFWSILTAFIGLAGYSRSVVLLDAVFSIVFLSAGRLLRRMQHGLVKDYRYTQRVLLVASGDAAERALRRIAGDRRSPVLVTGVLDPDPSRQGLRIHGVPVRAPNDLEGLLAENPPDVVLIEHAGLDADSRRHVIRACIRSDTPSMAVTRFEQLLAEGESRPALELEPEDLLFREPVAVGMGRAVERFSGQRILVTGAGGRIGSAIARHVARLGPARLVLLDRHEASLARVDREIRAEYPNLTVEPVIADVADAERVAAVFVETRPHAVFHAAASSHPALIQRHPDEAFRTNVRGVRIVSEAALRHTAEVFVHVSGSEAVNPFHPVGLSKRAGEHAVHELAGTGRTRCLSIRCGTVLEPWDSLLGPWREQIERGEPVTVSHPEATRLLQSSREVAELVLEAAALAEGGETLVLDPGKPVRVVDVARALIRGYGQVPDRDVPIVFGGLGAGERLDERLIDDHELAIRTSHPAILKIVTDDTVSWTPLVVPVLGSEERSEARPAPAWESGLVGAEAR